MPRIVGHVSLAIALSAYEQWLASPEASLVELLDTATDSLRHYLDT